MLQLFTMDVDVNNNTETDMETINVLLNGKFVKMQVIGSNDMASMPNSKADMIESGWEPVCYYAKRANGGRHHLVYKSARTGNYRSIVAV
jgi:hypothetical protein